MKTSSLFSSLLVALALGVASPAAQALAPTRIYDLDAKASTMDSMTVGADGHFYGTTWGRLDLSTVYTSELGPYYKSFPGEIFQYKLDGTYTTLHVFPMDKSEGQCPNPGLVQAADGNFYGTAFQGGAHGCGTIFRVTPAGSLTVLHHFNMTDGKNPWKLTLGSDGDLYGTTVSGTNYWGTIFKITTAGVFTSLANVPTTFDSFPAGLTQGPDGKFYGVTYHGTKARGRFYSVDTAGTIVDLAEVKGTGSWYHPNLTLGSDGIFYGTAPDGGSTGNGSVFSATTAGVVTTLASFDFFNGHSPVGGLREGSDGNLYGTTMYAKIVDPVSGAPVHQDGTVFAVTKSGFVTTLARFASLSNADNRIEGARPYSGVTFGTDGNLYGTTTCGGSTGGGVIFRLNAEDVEAELESTRLAALDHEARVAEEKAALRAKLEAELAAARQLIFAINEQPATQTVDCGQPMTLTVAVGGAATKTYQWRKNGRALANSARVAGAKTASLTVKNVGKADAATYSVLVTSKAGRVVQRLTSAGAVLKVNIIDTDADGVSDDLDRYAGTAAGDAVNKMGGSIAQLVPVSGPAPGKTWKNHGAYVGAVTRTATAFRKAKLITAAEASAIVLAAAQSNVGHAVAGL